MRVDTLTSLAKDVRKLPVAMQVLLAVAIDVIIAAERLENIPSIKKLKGFKNAYRVRLNDYRLCFYYENATITLARFLHRKDVYKFFP